MAKFNTNEEFDILAVAGSYTCNVDDPVDRYDITSVGAVTVAGTATITSSGTLYEGTTLEFRYLANITGGTVSLLGTNVPTHLLDKEFLAEGYYDGSAWAVTFYPNVNQSAIITPETFTTSSLTQIDSIYSSSSTINVAGQQLLDTFTIPANTFVNDGESFTLKLWGQCTTTPAELKTIDVEVTTGAITRTLYTNALVTDIIGNWTLEINVIVEPTIGSINPSGTLIAKADGTVDVDPYTTLVKPLGYDETVTQTISVYGTETTPSGNQIILLGGILTVN